MKTKNNWIIAKAIKVEPVKVVDEKLKLLRKDSNKNDWTDDVFEEHPFKMEVVVAPEVYSNNGIEYPCSLKKGQEFIMAGDRFKEAIESPNRLITWHKEQHSLVKHSEVIAIL
jgi:hypothetical protein